MSSRANNIIGKLDLDEPWNSSADYPPSHIEGLLNELTAELSNGHVLYECDIKILGKREDQDELLVFANERYYVVHLTWSGREESDGFPRTTEYPTLSNLKAKLSLDSNLY